MCDFADLLRDANEARKEKVMRRVAGHDFATIRPGERCQRENCEGIASLVELLALHEVVRPGDPDTAHTGRLEQSEIDQIKAAKAELDKQMAVVFGF